MKPTIKLLGKLQQLNDKIVWQEDKW